MQEETKIVSSAGIAIFFSSVENVLYAIEEDGNVVHGVITAVTRSFVVSYKPERGGKGRDRER